MSKESTHEQKRKRKHSHKESCQCYFCKAKRGEYAGTGNPMYDKTQTDKTKQKISVANTGKKYPNRKTPPPMTKEIKDKISLANIGRKHKKECQCCACKNKRGEYFGENSPFYGKRHSEEFKIKRREYNINNPNKKFTGTKIELKIREELEKRGFKKDKDYFYNIGLANIANVDIYLPAYRIVIECDGCRYHACHQCGFTKYFQESIENDVRKTKELTDVGYIVYHFWEHEINLSPEECINKIFFQIFRTSEDKAELLS